MTDAFYDPEQWRNVSPAAKQAAESRRLMETSYALQGKDYWYSWYENNYEDVVDRLTNNPSGLADFDLGMLASTIVRMYYSDDTNIQDEGGVTAEDMRKNAQALYDRIGSARIDDHLVRYNRQIAGELAAGQGGRVEKNMGQQILGGLLNVVGALDIGWRKVSAPVVGNTVGLVSRGLEGDGWRFRGSGELDVDGDGRVAFLEAGFARPAEEWWAKAINIVGETALDPTSWIGFGAGFFAKSAMRGIGRSWNRAGVATEEVARRGTALAAKGLKGLKASDKDEFVKGLFDAHMGNRRLLDEKAGSLDNYYKNLTGDPLEAMLKNSPEHMRDSLVRVWSGLEDGPLKAWAARQVPKGLKALDKSGKAGVRFAGKTLPWWKSSLTLGGGKHTGEIWNHQTVRLLGGEASPAFKAADGMLKRLRPRAGLPGEYGHGFADAYRQYQRAGRSDARMRVAYNRNQRLAKHSHAVRHFASNMQNIMDHKNERAVGWFVPGLNNKTVAGHLNKMAREAPDDAASARWRELKDLKSLADRNIEDLDPDMVPPALHRLIERNSPEQLREKLLTIDETYSAHIEKMRAEMVLKHKPPRADIDSYVPWADAETKVFRGGRDQEGVPLSPGEGQTWRDLVQEGQAMWVADGQVVHHIRDNTLTSSRFSQDRLEDMSKFQQWWEVAGAVWSTNALSPIKGNVTWTTNVMGSLTNSIIAGINPLVMARNMRPVAQLMKLHDKAISNMKAMDAIKSKFTKLTGEPLTIKQGRKKIPRELEEIKTAINTAIKTATKLEREQLAELRKAVNQLDTTDLKETSYLYSLRKMGLKDRGLSPEKATEVPEDLAEQIALLEAVGYAGVLGSGRTLDIRTAGFDDLAVAKNPVWREVQTEFDGVKGYFDKLKKGDTQAIIDTFSFGSSVLYQKTEDFLRTLGFKSALDQGATWDEAYELVAKSNFDYGDLRKAEANFRSTWSRFYTYPKNLVGEMTKWIIEDPGRTLAVTRSAYESVKFIHSVSFGENGEGHVDFLVPEWLESRPGRFIVGGAGGIVRAGIFEYAETLQALLGVAPAIAGEFSDAQPYSQVEYLESQEAAARVLSIFSGLGPESFKWLMETATERDSFTGRSLEHDDTLDHVTRTIGLQLPGVAQGITNISGAIDVSDEDYGDRRAMIRFLSFLDGVWSRSAEELDDQAQAEMAAEFEKAIEDANKNGLDIAVLSDLESAGAIDPQRDRRFLYGVPIERTDPDYESDESRESQRRPLTEQEELDYLVPSQLAELLGIDQLETPDGPLFDYQGYNNAVARHIVERRRGELSAEQWGAWAARNAVTSRKMRELSGIEPPKLPQNPADEFSDDELVAMIQEEFQQAGIMNMAEIAELFPYLGEAHRDYQQYLANGMTEEEARYEALQQLPDDFRSLTEPGFTPELSINPLPMTEEEYDRFERRADDLALTAQWLYGYDEWFSSFLSRVSLASNAERAVIGLPTLPSYSFPSGIPSNQVTLMDALRKIGV